MRFMFLALLACGLFVAFTACCSNVFAGDCSDCQACPYATTCTKLPVALSTPPLEPIPSCAAGQCRVPAVQLKHATKLKSRVTTRARWRSKCGRRGPRRFIRRLRNWRPLARIRARRCCR